MISLNTLTVELLRIIGEANKLCSNSLSESFLKENMKVDVKTFVTLLNSYSNKLEDILDGKEYLSDCGKLDRALHDASITKDKAIKAINGLNTVCENCVDEDCKNCEYCNDDGCEYCQNCENGECKGCLNLQEDDKIENSKQNKVISISKDNMMDANYLDERFDKIQK